MAHRLANGFSKQLDFKKDFGFAFEFTHEILIIAAISQGKPDKSLKCLIKVDSSQN